MKKLLSRFFKGNENEYLALDFCWDSIRGFVYKKENGVEIIKYGEDPVKKFGAFNAENFELDTIRKPALEVLKDMGIKDSLPRKKTIVFPPDLVRAKVFEISYRRERGGIIKSKEENDIHSKVLEEINERFKKEVQWDDLKKLKIIKTDIVEERAAGYKVSSIKGIIEKDLTFRVLVLFAGEKEMSLIKHLLFSVQAKEKDIYHRSELLSNFFEGTATFLEVGEENTMAISFKGGIYGVDVFNKGGSIFIKTLEKHLGISEARAKYMKGDYSKGNLSGDTKRRVKEILSSTLEDWKNKLKIKIGSDFISFASDRIYLLGTSAYLPGIKEGVEDLGVGRVTYLTPEDLKIKNKTKVAFNKEEVASLLLAFSNN